MRSQYVENALRTEYLVTSNVLPLGEARHCYTSKSPAC